MIKKTTQTLGPCKCPACGWDDGGHLRVCDWYADEYPPIPRPRVSTIVIHGQIHDDGEAGVMSSIDECGGCGRYLDQTTIRKPMSNIDRQRAKLLSFETPDEEGCY